MAKQTLDKTTRDAIKNARNLIEEAFRADRNEAGTRRRVERIFESIMGYDPFKHLTREKAVRGAGETEHVDFAIQLEEGEEVKPAIFIELKRVGIDLAKKHLKQVVSYAIDAGCEWVILTNGREWRLHHVEFGRPPQIKQILTWDLLEDEIKEIAECFSVIHYKNVKRGGLDELWKKMNVLKADNVLNAILCEDSLRLLRRKLKGDTNVLVSHEDIVSSIGRLLNESALDEMGKIKITLPERKPRTTRRKPKTSESESEAKPTAE